LWSIIYSVRFGKFGNQWGLFHLQKTTNKRKADGGAEGFVNIIIAHAPRRCPHAPGPGA